MDQDQAKTILMTVIKWLKILLAVLMFILGLFNESIKMNPNSTPLEVEEATDSLELSVYGLIATVIAGCPLMAGAGRVVMDAVSQTFCKIGLL